MSDGRQLSTRTPCPRSPSSAPAAQSSPRTCSAIFWPTQNWATRLLPCTTSTQTGSSTTKNVAERLAASRGAHPRIETHLDRSAALDGADYAISMFQIGGYRPSTVVDFEIPKKYGLRQTIGDTLGIGGIMRGLRTIPVFLDMARDMEARLPRRLAPELREPDGNQHDGPSRRRRRSRTSAFATACKAPRSTSLRTSTCRRRRSATSARASTTWRFI